MKNITMRSLTLSVYLLTLGACSNYLDVMPDNVPTIEHAFSLRSSAEKFLHTCYSYLPGNGSWSTNPGFSSGDEVWYYSPISAQYSSDYISLARGLQNATDPIGNYWSGRRSGKPLYEALRTCNIFLENIHKVPDMEPFEQQRWIGEVTFLKAYYHFLLMRMYGPIPLMREALPISAASEEVRVYRAPIDECVDYVVSLLDEAITNESLPNRIAGTETSELGRITKAVVYAIKAKVLVTAASPFFNGNTDYNSLLVDAKGSPLFNPQYNEQKWERAATACKEAIAFCEANGYGLSRFRGNSSYVINDTISTQLDIRSALTEVNDNIEVIWPNVNSSVSKNQHLSMPRLSSYVFSGNDPWGLISPTLKLVEKYYTKNGVPIEEDTSWDYNERYSLRIAGDEDKFIIADGEQTVNLHFDREPRFYASIGFDRGIWFGNWEGNYNVNAAGGLLFPRARFGEISARIDVDGYVITGYWPKKLVNIETFASRSTGNMLANIRPYPWPEIRMADLYLLAAEASNEWEGPSDEALSWVNLVRERAGLQSIESSWTAFSSNPDKFRSKEGLRAIIQQERTIELAFEGVRYWDLRRWKRAHVDLNEPIVGWNIEGETAATYYRRTVLFNQQFRIQDYLWPIEHAELRINGNLTQNPGW